MTAEQLAPYDVVWTTPSDGPAGSMPVGNGDLAANVWVEPNGDLLLLVAKSDAWDENSSLLKLGRVRVRCEPPLVSVAWGNQADFRQRLGLADATVVVEVIDTVVYLWADAHDPVIHVQIKCASPRSVVVSIEVWRDYPYRLTPTQTGDLFKNLTGADPYPTIVTPDETGSGRAGELAVWHRNAAREPDPYATNLILQGLGDAVAQTPSPLTGRTFGMTVVGHDFTDAGPREIRSVDAAYEHRVDVHALTSHVTVDAWRSEMRRLIDRAAGSLEASVLRHKEFWSEFWQRSTLRITSATDAENTFNVTRGYLLQRYTNACQGRGAQPIKFNGGLFSVGRPWDPDFRRWGGPGFWFQNTRLVYWPMLADGDFDLMLPWLRMYRDCLPLQRHRTHTYYGHAGAHYPETMTFWGAEVSGHYGWTPFEQREHPEAECAYLTYHWSGAIELVLILCDYVGHTQDKAVAAEMLTPIAAAVLDFYEQHYPRDPDGRLRFEPAQALETWHRAINPMPEIAGLHYTLGRLMSLDVVPLPPALLDQARRLQAILPPLPVGDRDGQRVLLPAAAFDVKKNTENPELYCVFPFRLFGVGKPDVDLARRTFARRRHVEQTCWHQDALQMALLGLTDEAKDFVCRRAAPACASDSRFPAFWNAHHDWVPDVDHGGVLQLAVQNMLVQCEGRTIRLLPAWPADWDAEFKFHLPGPAVIEGRVRNGRLEDWTITPADRAKDVLVPSPGTPGED